MPVPPGAIAERRLIERLMRARAFTPDSSQPLVDLRWVETRRLQRLLGKGIIREHAPGRYYLDGPALADRFAFLRVVRAIALIAVVLIASIAMAFVVFNGAAASRLVP